MALFAPMNLTASAEDEVRCVVLCTVVVSEHCSLWLACVTWNGVLVDDDLIFVAIEVGRVIAVSVALAVVAVKAIESLLDWRASAPCGTEPPLAKAASGIALFFENFSDG